MIKRWPYLLNGPEKTICPLNGETTWAPGCVSMAKPFRRCPLLKRSSYLPVDGADNRIGQFPRAAEMESISNGGKAVNASGGSRRRGWVLSGTAGNWPASSVPAFRARSTRSCSSRSKSSRSVWASCVRRSSRAVSIWRAASVLLRAVICCRPTGRVPAASFPDVLWPAEDPFFAF